MSILNGLTQCWEIGPTCRPWWEAWAAVGGSSAAATALVALVVAWIGIGVTAASAFAVWKLGMAANTASAEATRIAGSEAERSVKESERREYRERTEELLIFAQITGEVGTAIGRLDNTVKALIGGGVGKQLFLGDEKYRKHVFDDLDRLKFPMIEAVRDRLHYMGRMVAGCLLRATGITPIAQESYAIVGVDGAADDLAQLYDGLMFLLPLIRTDLGVVQASCTDAINQLGLADVNIALAAAAFDSDD